MDARLPVRAFFTNRLGGVSTAPFAELNAALHVGDNPVDVATNRSIIEQRAGVRVVFMRPRHGSDIAVLGREYLDGREPPEADVLVTAVPGLALATLAADCVPLLIHDGSSGAVAAVHIGREGLRKGVVDAAIAALSGLRGATDPQETMKASIGPAICGHCYEVPLDVRDQVARMHPIAASTTRWGTPALDISGAVSDRLLQLGVTDIVRNGACTFEDESLFSYRRQRVTGRQVGVVVCEA